MNNVRHSVGDKVVALSSQSKAINQPRIKGKIYIVKDVIYCGVCGVQKINLGLSLDLNEYYDTITCFCCNNKFPARGKYWTLSGAFAPLSETSLQHAVEEENYELAAIIRDALKTEKV